MRFLGRRPDNIADYIALDRPEAACRLVQKIFAHVQQLADFALYSPRGMLAQSSLLPRPQKGFVSLLISRIIWQADLGPSEGSRFQPIMFAVKHLFLW